MSRGNRAHRAGFTLAELIIALVVLLILGAILFPIFAKPYDCGGRHRAYCQSHLKQLGLAMLQYAQDYDDRLPLDHGHRSSPPFPAAWEASPHGQGYYGWYERNEVDHVGPRNWGSDIMPYVKNQQIFVCPESQDSLRVPLGDEDDKVSYAYSVYLGEQRSGEAGATTTRIARPSRTVMLWCTGVIDWSIRTRGAEPDAPRCLPTWEPRHNGGRNLLFVDGHVKCCLDRDVTHRTHPAMWDWRLPPET